MLKHTEGRGAGGARSGAPHERRLSNEEQKVITEIGYVTDPVSGSFAI